MGTINMVLTSVLPSCAADVNFQTEHDNNSNMTRHCFIQFSISFIRHLHTIQL